MTNQREFIDGHTAVVNIKRDESDNAKMLALRDRALYLCYAGSHLSVKDFLDLRTEDIAEEKFARPLWYHTYDPYCACHEWIDAANLKENETVWRSFNRWGIMPATLSQTGFRVVLTAIGFDVSISKWKL
jgi:hypothetical protein